MAHHHHHHDHRDGAIVAPEFARHDAEYRARPSSALVDAYAPETLEEVCGNDEAKSALEECVASGVRQPLVVCGPAGVGKHTAVRLLLRKYEYDVREFAMSVHSVDVLQARQGDPDDNVMLALLGRPSRRAVVCSDVDAMPKGERGRLLSLLRAMSAHTLCVVVGALPLDRCACVRFEELAPADVGVHTCWVAACEGLPWDEASAAGTGDMRSALNALQFGRADATWSRAGDDPWAAALRCRETLRSGHADPLAAAARLLDALSAADAQRFYDRDALNEAAAAAARAGRFEPAGKTTLLARHAQSVARNNTLRHAARKLGLRPHEASLGAPALSAGMRSLDADELHALATLSRPADRRAIRELVRTKSQI